MPFLENAIYSDTYLIPDYPEVVSLADNLFEEVIGKDKRRTKTRMERYKSNETLKIILINLIVGYESEVAIRYSLYR